MKTEAENLSLLFCSCSCKIGEVYRERSSQVLTFNWEAGAASSSFLFPRLESKWMVADFVP